MIGLTWSTEEVAIWRQRVGLTAGTPMFKSANDVFTGSPGLWDTYILPGANACVASPLSDRFNNCYTGIMTYTNFPDNAIAGNYEPRPETKNSHNSTYAAFAYLLTQNESYANAVRTVLLSYANDPMFNYANTSKWVIGNNSMRDLNPGFYIAEWMCKMLINYDMCKESTSFSIADQLILDKWFKDYSRYTQGVYNYDCEKYTPYRSQDNYTVIQNRDTQSNRLWYNGPFSYTLHLTYNNRRDGWAKYDALYGVKYGDSISIASGIRYFKEKIAYGSILDETICTEFYRGSASLPEQGTAYAGISTAYIVQVADAFARLYNTSLYDYVLTQEEVDKFFPSGWGHEAKAWYPTTAVVGKSTFKAVYSYLKFWDGSYGNGRQWDGENINGYSTKAGLFRNYNHEHNLSQANIYYQNADFKAIYNREKAGQTPHTLNPSYYGSYRPWFGLFSQMAGQWLQYGLMEGLVYPYGEDTPPPDPPSQNSGGWIDESTITRKGILR